MIVYKVFAGSLVEIEAAFNAWAASLVAGAKIGHSPLQPDGHGGFFKEIMCELPVRMNGRVPQIAIPGDVN